MSTEQKYTFLQVAAHLAPLFSIIAVLSGFFCAGTIVLAFSFYGRFGLLGAILHPFSKHYTSAAGVYPVSVLDLFIRATFQTININR